MAELSFGSLIASFIAVRPPFFFSGERNGFGQVKHITLIWLLSITNNYIVNVKPSNLS